MARAFSLHKNIKQDVDLYLDYIGFISLWQKYLWPLVPIFRWNGKSRMIWSFVIIPNGRFISYLDIACYTLVKLQNVFEETFKSNIWRNCTLIQFPDQYYLEHRFSQNYWLLSHRMYRSYLLYCLYETT